MTDDEAMGRILNLGYNMIVVDSDDYLRITATNGSTSVRAIVRKPIMGDECQQILDVILND